MSEIGAPFDRRGHALEVDERFQGDALDERLWLPAYLPQWSSRAATMPRLDVGGGRLTLRIDADQAPWSPEWNGGLRVSNLQTGVRSGPVGSTDGQHRFRADLVVREAQPEQRLYTPCYGLFELTARATDDPDAMAALWMIGFEDVPERSAEICVAEVFGRDVTAHETRVGMGLHPFGDTTIRDDFAAVPLPIDARETHTYAVTWRPGEVAWYVDELCVRIADQAPDYPMQLMLDLYAFPRDVLAGSPPAGSGATFVVERFRGWRPVAGPAARGPAFPAQVRRSVETTRRSPARSGDPAGPIRTGRCAGTS